MSSITQSSLPNSDALRDTFQWKRKEQSMAVLLISTTTWVLLEVYQFSFLTVISWAAMFIVTSMFLWGNILKLLWQRCAKHVVAGNFRRINY
ncbi:reticulon-like protein B13 [Quercus lobata]|uniref:reticulon-like protein B13 n=1 Tax=Quercus lobata TaxID=97700 RepID=UPI001243B414|nr:reticulon-like protein B13 [Quercus lobata]